MKKTARDENPALVEANDRPLIFITLGLLVAFGLALLMKSHRSAPVDAVGEIRTEGAVKTLPVHSPKWQEAHVGSSVHVGELVSSSHTAILSVGNQGEIVLSPGSVVEIQRDGEGKLQAVVYKGTAISNGTVAIARQESFELPPQPTAADLAAPLLPLPELIKRVR